LDAAVRGLPGRYTYLTRITGKKDKLTICAPRSLALQPPAYVWGVVLVRLGEAADVDAAVAVYERSNLARRHGAWPGRAARVDHVRARLRDPDTWLLVAIDGPEMVAMAAARPLRERDGEGPVIPGACFLGFLYVVPERWGRGIGGAVMDAVLAEAKRRRQSRTYLLTHPDNERSQRLYRSRGFAPTGRGANGQAEWVREPGQSRG